MRENPVISVIIPIYNAIQYLDECVESVVKQTYSKLQIILVDDGSTDGSSKLCDEWKEKDTRIHVIHKKNGGGAQARNVGIEHAIGDLIAFVDSDDRIHVEMYKTLYEIMQEYEADIAECGYATNIQELANNYISYKDSLQIYNTEQAMEKNIEDTVLRQLVWNKLYTRECVGDIRFVEGKFIDDEFWTYRVIGNAKKAVVSNISLYYYRQQEGSAMHQKYSLKWLESVEAKVCRQEFLEKQMPTIATAGKIRLIYTCLYHGQLSIKYLKGENRKTAFKFLRKIIRKYRVNKKDLNDLKISDKVWFWAAGVSLNATCTIRNRLRIGY